MLEANDLSYLLCLSPVIDSSSSIVHSLGGSLVELVGEFQTLHYTAGC